MKAFSFAILMLCLSTQAIAQSSGVTGVVLDEKGQPATDVVIQVLEKGIVYGSCKTDTNGMYDIRQLNTGRYFVVRASGAFYKISEVRGVVLSPDVYTFVNINLQPRLPELDDVNITNYKIPNRD